MLEAGRSAPCAVSCETFGGEGLHDADRQQPVCLELSHEEDVAKCLARIASSSRSQRPSTCPLGKAFQTAFAAAQNSLASIDSQRADSKLLGSGSPPPLETTGCGQAINDNDAGIVLLGELSFTTDASVSERSEGHKKVQQSVHDGGLQKPSQDATCTEPSSNEETAQTALPEPISEAGALGIELLPEPTSEACSLGPDASENVQTGASHVADLPCGDTETLSKDTGNIELGVGPQEEEQDAHGRVIATPVSNVSVAKDPDRQAFHAFCREMAGKSSKEQAATPSSAEKSADDIVAASTRENFAVSAADAKRNKSFVTEWSPSPSAEPAGQQVESQPSTPPAGATLVTEEGASLAEALSEARAALDFARRFVSSPSLERINSISKRNSQEAADDVSRSAAAAVAAPSREHVNALHARFGPPAARARVASKEKSRDVQESLDKRKQAEQKLQRDSEEAAKSEPLRRRAALRAKSEQRARREEQQQQAEEDALMRAKKAADAESSKRYSRCAARRAKSEQQRRQALAQEVLTDILKAQHERLEEDQRRGDDLQRRCEDKDWSSCAPVVNTQTARKPPCGPGGPRTPNGYAPSSLPRIVPRGGASPRHTDLDICKSNQASRESPGYERTLLPPLIPV